MMDDERIKAITEALWRDLSESMTDVIGATSADITAATVALVADAYHRRGVPVSRARVEGTSIVFDITAPCGIG